MSFWSFLIFIAGFLTGGVVVIVMAAIVASDPPRFGPFK